MDLLTLLTKFAENTHHQLPISDLIKKQSVIIQEAFVMNSNAQMRNILSGNDIPYPDRDAVAKIEQ